jgi:hypothetical protein
MSPGNPIGSREIQTLTEAQMQSADEVRPRRTILPWEAHPLTSWDGHGRGVMHSVTLSLPFSIARVDLQGVLQVREPHGLGDEAVHP